MPELAYVDGRFTDLSNARISVEDRGFQFADGVYEVVVAPGGRPFKLQEHLHRLCCSTEAINIPIDYHALNLPRIIEQGIRRCGFDNVLIYIQITRGVASRNHIFEGTIKPTVVLTFKQKPVYDPMIHGRGVDVETIQDVRWVFRTVKSVALLSNILLKNAARQRGYWDAVIVGGDGYVRETTSANVFMVKDGVVRTVPATDHILHGVTRSCVIEFARDLDLQCEEAEFTVPEMLAADEVFITSTTLDVLPIRSVNDQTIGDGHPGPITKKLLGCFPTGWPKDDDTACQLNRGAGADCGSSPGNANDRRVTRMGPQSTSLV